MTKTSNSFKGYSEEFKKLNPEIKEAGINLRKRMYEIGYNECKSDVEKIINKLPTITGCKYADSIEMNMIQREELLKKLKENKI